MTASLVLTAFGVIVSFQNCSKTRFSADHDAVQANESASLTTAEGIVANPPPPEVTICNFGSASACDIQHAFVGNLFIQPRTLLTDSGSTYANGPVQGDMDVDHYVMNPVWLATKDVNGQAQPVAVALSSLDSLNNQFATGFSTEDGQSFQVPDAHGKLGSVPNYFALDLKAKFHLAPGDAPGEYQFAIIADDGARVYVTDVKGNNPQLLIDDSIPFATTNHQFIPGSQYARMGCSPVIGDVSKIKTFTMQADTVVPLEVRYLNGPSGLSLRVMYRQVPAAGAVDRFCETDVNGDPSTKPTLVDLPLVLDTKQLGSWKTIDATNL